MSSLLGAQIVGAIDWGAWKFTPAETTVDLIAAGTNALNGALLARRPDHFRNFTVVGILLMALLGGIGGGVTRDVLVNKIPGALTNPAYISLCLLAGVIGYYLAFGEGQLFREGLFQFMTSFSLPWYAIVGAQVGIQVGLPVFGALALAVVGPTAGRYLIDITSGVTPKQFLRGEWFVGTAVLTGAVWILLDDQLGDSTGAQWAAYLIAFAVGFTFRIVALFRGWEEPLAKEPAGVYLHDDGRPLLGRKLKGKSQTRTARLGPDPRHPGRRPRRPGGMRTTTAMIATRGTPPIGDVNDIDALGMLFDSVGALANGFSVTPAAAVTAPVTPAPPEQASKGTES